VLIAFFARCRNPLSDAAVVFDDLMKDTFASISYSVLPDRVWTAASMPISTPDWPELELNSAKNIMSAAHLAGLSAARSVLSKLHQLAFSRLLSLLLMSGQRSMTSAPVEIPRHPLLAIIAARCVTSRSPWLVICIRRWRRSTNNNALRRSCVANRRCL
jgi:hypothetical protein